MHNYNLGDDVHKTGDGGVEDGSQAEKIAAGEDQL